MATVYASSCIQQCLFVFALFVIGVARTETGECDKSLCRGPIKYYESLGCKPVFKNSSSCCAERYDCDHLKQRSPNKCYVNGHEYEIDEVLREEDKNTCDFGCKCIEKNGYGSFMCSFFDCVLYGGGENCYTRRPPGACCPDRNLVCHDKPEDRPTCEVDGKIYKDGEHFVPKSDPDMDCYCVQGYSGENIPPYCYKPNRPFCSPDFYYSHKIQAGCAPVFYESSKLQTDCNKYFRCQTDDDFVIVKSEANQEDGLKCVYGNMTLNVNDELNMGPNYKNSCIKCVCELPPYPTCYQIDYEKCNQEDTVTVTRGE